ncbi:MULTISPECIES: hypothetical protein [unclassified Haladaptatus]|uniref:hypothetical protein n=1 Tax=unclassified Haladaptatus TaxID=2622732 RepID=UPI002FCE1C16
MELSRRTFLGSTAGLIAISSGCVSQFTSSTNDDEYARLIVVNGTDKSITANIKITPSKSGNDAPIFEEQLIISPEEDERFDGILERGIEYTFIVETNLGLKETDTFTACRQGDSGCYIEIFLSENEISMRKIFS